MNAAEVEKKQYNRFLILYEVYKTSTLDVCNVTKLAYEKNIKNGIFKAAFAFLVEEGLLKKSLNGADMATITHEGIKAIEWSIMNPEKRTDNFPSFKDLGLNE